MTQDEIKELAYNAGFSIANGIVTGGITDLKRFAKLVAAKEREACLKLAEKYQDHWTIEAIRAKGESDT
jgi:hypothetical protein